MSAAAQNLTVNPAQAADAGASPNLKDPVESMPWLPCTLTLEVPVAHFTIADLLGLEKGSIVETAWSNTSDVPLRVNQLLVGWTEFEVVGDRLAVRITEQA